MSLVLLLPAGLLAGAALVLPVLLHLQRARDTRRVDFAGLRWLRARLRPRRRLRIREWLLLVLRLLLVLLVALVFAQPAWIASDRARPRVYLAPGIPPAAARSAARDLSADADWRRLAPGLPMLDAAAPASPALPAASSAPDESLSSLLREADARTPPGARLVVLVPPLLRGLDRERPRLAHAVDWRVLPDSGPTSLAPSPPTDESPPPARPPTLRLRYAGAAEPPAAHYLRAAAAAWSAAPLPGSGDSEASRAAPGTGALAPRGWLAWIGPGNLPPDLQAWVARGGTALVVPGAPDAARARADSAAGEVAWRRDDGVVLARATPLGRGQVLTLTVPISPVALPEVLEPDFPRRLRRLFEGPPQAPTLAPADALRPRTGGPRFPLVPDTLLPWLALAAALAFFCERLLATRARREART